MWYLSDVGSYLIILVLVDKYLSGEGMILIKISRMHVWHARVKKIN
jgi:hypothetical protein